MSDSAALDRALIVLVCGFLVLAVSFGIRISFGFMLVPVSEDMAWSITSLSFILAVQNLMWGVMQPFAGGLADRFGAAKVVAGGALLYASGLAVMASSDSQFMFGAGAGVMIGAAQAALGFPVVLGALGRTAPESSRSLLTGVAVAGGSFGQLMFAPIGQRLVDSFGWVDAVWLLAAAAAGAAVLGLGLLREVRKPRAPKPAGQSASPQVRDVFGGPQTAVQAAAQALRHRGFQLLTAGFFVCGFQLAFVSVHLPKFAAICGLTPVTASTGLALIGGFNIIGTVAAGWIGGKFIPKYPLALIYFLRGMVCLMLVMVPVTETVLYVFSVCMGLLWLSTVPLTNTIVGRIFGQQYVGMLFGVVFFSHQLGSFVGLWMAGALFDATGNYDLMWWISAALGLLAALVNLPINDTRVNPAPAAA
ncbi:MAG: MFS transporter [Rhodospirillales bacterium]